MLRNYECRIYPSQKQEARLCEQRRPGHRPPPNTSGRRREVLCLAKATLKVENQRSDFLHQLSLRLANEYSMIAVEDLQIENMVKNHHVAKSFNDTGLGTLIIMLDYKVSETGSQLVKVDPSYTSQTCSRCGQIKEGAERLSLSDRTYHCRACGLSLDRDLDAAINILTRAGLARSHACGDNARPSIEKAVVAEAGTISSARG